MTRSTTPWGHCRSRYVFHNITGVVGAVCLSTGKDDIHSVRNQTNEPGGWYRVRWLDIGL